MQFVSAVLDTVLINTNTDKKLAHRARVGWRLRRLGVDQKGRRFTVPLERKKESGQRKHLTLSSIIGKQLLKQDDGP
jgi:hypothetical protein